MKKISFVAPALLVTAFAAMASADQPVRATTAVNPAAVAGVNSSIFVNWSWVKGTIKVPTGSASIAGMQCSDLTVTAFSQDTQPRPAGYTGLWLSPPKWSHTAVATGNYAGGTCSYSSIVAPNSNFAVTVNGAANQLKCNIIQPSVTPAQAGWFTVPVGGTKTQDFTISSLACEILK